MDLNEILKVKLKNTTYKVRLLLSLCILDTVRKGEHQAEKDGGPVPRTDNS